MNQMLIENLSFCCEQAFSNTYKVTGGANYSTSYAVQSASDHSSGYISLYSVKTTGGIQYIVAGGVNGAVAGAVAGAIAVGSTAYTGAFAASYASA